MTRSVYGFPGRAALHALVFLSMIHCKQPAPPAPPPARSVAPPHSVASAPVLPPAEPAVAAITVNPESRAPGLGVVLASRLNVRSVPQAAGADTVRGVLRCGDIVSIQSVVGDQGEWYQVELDKLAGYSHGSYIVRLGPGGKFPLCQFSFQKKKQAESVKDPEQAVAPRPQPGPAHEPEKEPTPATAPEAGQKVAERTPALIPTPAPSPAVEERPEVSPGPVAVAPPDAAVSTLSAARPAPPRDPSALATPPATAAMVIDAGRTDITLGLHATRARPVEFPHKKHQAQFACFRCHHPVTTTAGVLHKAAEGDINAVKGCHTCHTATSQAAVRPTSEDVFHSICRDCHRTTGGKKAPTSCSDCHK